jgi:GNAT superfamily N-acetyltransferase
MIRFIPVEAALPVRNEVLREGKLTLDQCRFAGDELPDAFHLGYFANELLVSIATFHPQSYKDYSGIGYQLRGMATIEQFRGLGFGYRLLASGINYLREKHVNYVWCNARKKALTFYLHNGFEVISDEFELPKIGPHYVLYMNLA